MRIQIGTWEFEAGPLGLLFLVGVVGIIASAAVAIWGAR